MNPAAGESPAPSPLDKPLAELTEDDVAQLTREDCRRFLKQKGMRRPSWNKSQAIQQVISLKALLDSHRDFGDGTLMRKDSLPTPPPPPTAAVTTPQVPVASPYRRKDPTPNPNPNRVTFGSHATGVAACVGTNPPESQMTIFYGGRVIVYNDVPDEKARALMQLAATPEPGPAYPNPTGVPRLGPGLVPTPGKPVPSLRDNVNWSLARESEPEGPTNRQASLQRYREKRKDRFKGKKIIGGPSSPSMDMMYLSQKFSSQTANEQASQSDTSSPTQPRPPPTPTRCSSIEKQSQKLRFFVDLNDDGFNFMK